MSAAVAHIEISRITDVLERLPGHETGWLSESEGARLAHFRNLPRRTQYLAGHWLTRELLAGAFGGLPQQWRLFERKDLPPQVTGKRGADSVAASIRVSISHTADWIAAGIASVAIGIDLEQRPRKLDAAIEPLLLNADDPAGSLDADTLLQRWVAKEAWIKRNAESALPERIRRLQLRAAERDRADVRIDSHAAFHFGLAIAPGCVVNMRCDVPLLAGRGFVLTDNQG